MLPARDALRLCALLFTFSVFTLTASAQNAGIVRGTINDLQGGAISGATVMIQNATSGFSRQTISNDEGHFEFRNIPFNAYTLIATQAGFGEASAQVDLHSTVPVDAPLALAVASLSEEVTVTAQAERDVSGTETTVDQQTLSNLTGALPSRQLESVVLSAPGIVKDENGRFHPRGSHYQTSFVIDGVPVSDQLSTTFGNNFDARDAAGLEVQTGNIAPEFGNKVAAVVQVTSASGLDSGRRFNGQIAAGGGSFNAGEGSFKLAGKSAKGKFGFFVSGASGFSSRFLDPPFQNATADFGGGQIVTAGDRGLHNYGNEQRFFTRLDYIFDDNNIFNIKFVAGRTRFDVPNLPSQQLNGQDQSQRNRDLSIYPQFQHIFNATTSLTIAPYFRLSTANLTGSPGDTPVQFNVQRRLVNTGLVANLSYVGRGHRIKTGIDTFAFPAREGFDFNITDSTFNQLPANSVARINADGSVTFAFDPTLSAGERDALLEGFNPNLIAFDPTVFAQAAANGSVVTGNVRRFRTNPKRTGKEFSAYIQDTYTFRNLTLSGGVRFDAYRFLVNDNGVSPRVGIAYAIPQSGTVFRGSYNRVVQTPSTEYLLISESDESVRLVNPRTVAILGTGVRRIRSERGNWFEFGAQQSLGRIGRFDASYYRKRINDLHDNDQFLNTSVVFPVSLTRGRIDGFDARFEAARYKHFGGYLSLGSVRAIVRPPFSGGLFLGGEPAATVGGEEFRIDHDQKLNLQGALQYDNQSRGLTAQLIGRYDSGLVTEFEDPEFIATSPDLASGLRYINFSGDPLRVKPRAIFDFSFGYDFLRRENNKLGVQVDVLNFTDKQGLYNFLSVFSGTHYIAPRSFNARLKYDF